MEIEYYCRARQHRLILFKCSLDCSSSRPQFSQQSSQGSSHILLQPLLHSGPTPTCLSIGGKHPRHHLVLRWVRVVVTGRLSAGALLPWWLPHISPIHACARPVTACNYTVIQNSEPLCSTFSCHTNSMVVERPTSHMSRITRSKVAPSLHVLADKGLGVNHYRDNHYQWPPLPYDTHYQCQSLPDDNYYHWRPLPTTTTKFHLAKKSLPATTTTWQQLPYDDQYHMTTITIWLPPPYYQNYYISFNHMLFAKMYVWKLKLLNFSLVLRNIKIWPDGIKYICNGELLYTYFLWRLNLTLPQLTEHQASIE